MAWFVGEDAGTTLADVLALVRTLKSASGYSWSVCTDQPETVGAGVFSPDAECLGEAIRVGGEAKAMRGELAAPTRVLQRTHPEQPLALGTDCLPLLDILARWKRCDFAAYADEEPSWDILFDLLTALCCRRARTIFFWLKAHAGDPGNCMADYNAELGCYLDEVCWDRPTHPYRLRDITQPACPIVSPHGWTSAAERHARILQGRHMRDRLSTATALSTVVATATETGRPSLGAALRDGGLPDFALRDFMQARSHCFPTAALVVRNKPGLSPLCPLCHQEDETLGHTLMRCAVLHDSTSAAHNAVASVLFETLAAELTRAYPQLRVDLRLELRLGEITPATFDPAEEAARLEGEGIERPMETCLPALSALRPDAVLLLDCPAVKDITVLEFTRVMDTDVTALERCQVRKANKYRAATLYLQHLYPHHTVRAMAFAASATGVLPETSWNEQMAALRLVDDAAHRRIQVAALMAVVRVLHESLNNRRAALRLHGRAVADDFPGDARGAPRRRRSLAGAQS